MTNEQKTEAPDHLWVDTFSKDSKAPNWPTKPVWAATQYTRTALSQAAVAATVRVCAEVFKSRQGIAPDLNFSAAISDVLSLAPNAQQALDKLLGEKEREAKRMGLEFAIEWFEDHHVRLKENQAKEIRAALEAE